MLVFINKLTLFLSNAMLVNFAFAVKNLIILLHQRHGISSIHQDVACFKDEKVDIRAIKTYLRGTQV